jgi:hypothetical protein
MVSPAVIWALLVYPLTKILLFAEKILDTFTFAVLAMFAVITRRPNTTLLVLLTGTTNRLLNNEFAVTVLVAVISLGSGNKLILLTTIFALAHMVKLEVI